MSKVDDLFNRAYSLHVVEEKHRDAINLCRQALELDPDNYRVRVFLGMLLGDHGNEEEIRESRELFVEAIKRAESNSLFCTTWPEEAAIQHLGMWEWNHGAKYNACLFFLIDYLYCNNRDSHRYLLELLEELDPDVCTIIKLLLQRKES